MNKAFTLMFFAITALAISQLGAQPIAGTGGAAMPTTQQLQSLIDARQYPQVIQQSQRMLAVRGPAAKDVDKYDVLLLRAEAYLQQKQQGQAITTFQQAARETNDPTKAGLPKAMVTLLQKSKAMVYTPKAGKDPSHPVAPLNIAESADRKLALQSLFEEEWKPTQAKIEALKKRGNTSLTPIIEAAGLTGEMRGLEIAATGTDKETSTALSDLTDSAAKLMTDYLEREAKRVEEISYSANMRSSNNINDVNVGRIGLTGAQRTELQETDATCQKLATAAELVAASAGAKASQFTTIATRSTDLAKKAQDVLNADYSEMIDNRSNGPVQRGAQPGGSTGLGAGVQSGVIRRPYR